MGLRILFSGVLAIAVLLSTALDARGARRQDDRLFVDGFDPYGVLLEGPPERLAIDAIFDMPPVRAPDADVQDDLILTRLDVFIDRTASVGQINAALIAVDGLIVTMTSGRAALTISIPRAADAAALRAIRDELRSHPGVLMAALAEVATGETLPDSPAGDDAEIGYLYASRFPAAWNVSRLATNGCAKRKVSMRILDHFGTLPQGLANRFHEQLPDFDLFTGPAATSTAHGYEVAMTAASRFDANIQTGANPFPECLVTDGADGSGMSWVQRAPLAWVNLPDDDHAVVNISLGNHRPCTTSCTPAAFDIGDVLSDAFKAIDWRAGTRARDASVLYVTAAGNDLDRPISSLYPYYAYANFASPMNLASSPQFLGEFANDDSDDFTFLQDHGFLDSPSAGFPSLVASDADVESVRTYARQNLGFGVLPAPNTIITGSATRAPDPSQVQESAFSDTGSTVLAVGEGVATFVNPLGSGTSVSAPQVTGLASYLWLLSEELRSAPMSRTMAAIRSNAHPVDGTPLLDAYASVLSLDAADPTTLTPSPQTMPIRLALLDINGDGAFNNADLTDIQEHLLLKGGGGPQDWSRYDLNGDGYTGDFHAARFDLDRVGSTQFGATRYSTVTESFDGLTRSFDENLLLDIDILCYYAYSPLYTGDVTLRAALIGSVCADPFGGQSGLDLGAATLKRGFSGSGSGFAFGDAGLFPQDPTVARFSFSSMGWSAPDNLSPAVDGNFYMMAAMAANGASSGAMAIFQQQFNSVAPLKWRRYDPGLGAWTVESFIDISAMPRASASVKPAVALSASGRAAAVWVTLVAPNQWALAVSRFDPAEQQWSAPEQVGSSRALPTGLPPVVLADDSGYLYVWSYTPPAFGSSTPAISIIYRFDMTTGVWAEIERFPGDYSIYLGLDHAGRMLALGAGGGEFVSSLYDPASGHWSSPIALPPRHVGRTSEQNEPAHVLDFASAIAGGGSESCANGLFCVDAHGNALLVTPIATNAVQFPITLEAVYYSAPSNQWRSLGIVGTGIGFSVGMGYQTGSADIAWATDEHGAILSRHFDPQIGLGPPQTLFRSTPGTNYSYLYPPVLLHDEGSAAVVAWSHAESQSGSPATSWARVH